MTSIKSNPIAKAEESNYSGTVVWYGYLYLKTEKKTQVASTEDIHYAFCNYISFIWYCMSVSIAALHLLWKVEVGAGNDITPKFVLFEFRSQKIISCHVFHLQYQLIKTQLAVF